MTNIINLNDVRQARQIHEEKAKIVLASHVDEAFAKYHEYEGDEEFLAVLAEIETISIKRRRKCFPNIIGGRRRGAMPGKTISTPSGATSARALIHRRIMATR